MHAKPDKKAKYIRENKKIKGIAIKGANNKGIDKEEYAATSAIEQNKFPLLRMQLRPE